MRYTIILFAFVLLNSSTEFAQTRDSVIIFTNPLPVQMIYFEAFPYLNTVLLRWGTATETNNYGYDVQRTQNPGDSTVPWDVLGFVPGSGNSNSEKNYVFKDTTAVRNNIYYYRLKQIDFDGSPHFTDTLTVEFYLTDVTLDNSSPKTFSLKQNYPNPFNSETNINFSLDKQSDAVITIYDNLGRVIKSMYYSNLSAGEHTSYLNFENYSTGVYFYTLKAENHFAVNKMLFLK